MDVAADALCFTSARDLARQIRSRQVSCREVMTAFLAQISRLNPDLNAIVAKLDDEHCLALADKADRALGNGGPGFGITGPFGSFAPLGDVSKITMIALMWLGRLEIIPVVVLLTRHYWRV